LYQRAGKLQLVDPLCSEVESAMTLSITAYTTSATFDSDSELPDDDENIEDRGAPGPAISSQPNRPAPAV
jgi:hypothetical protein